MHMCAATEVSLGFPFLRCCLLCFRLGSLASAPQEPTCLRFLGAGIINTGQIVWVSFYLLFSLLQNSILFYTFSIIFYAVESHWLQLLSSLVHFPQLLKNQPLCVSTYVYFWEWAYEVCLYCSVMLPFTFQDLFYLYVCLYVSICTYVCAGPQACSDQKNTRNQSERLTYLVSW